MHEVFQPPQVAVLPVPLLPWDVVLQRLTLRQRGGLPEVNNPDLCITGAVVDEEEGAADDLETEKMKVFNQTASISHKVQTLMKKN